MSNRHHWWWLTKASPMKHPHPQITFPLLHTLALSKIPWGCCRKDWCWHLRGNISLFYLLHGHGIRPRSPLGCSTSDSRMVPRRDMIPTHMRSLEQSNSETADMEVASEDKRGTDWRARVLWEWNLIFRKGRCSRQGCSKQGSCSWCCQTERLKQAEMVLLTCMT